MYMSNNGRVKVVIESCILLIALVIVSCLYTAELSKSRNVLKEENKNGVVHEEKKQSNTVKMLYLIRMIIKQKDLKILRL